jgi:hypothetical protein
MQLCTVNSRRVGVSDQWLQFADVCVRGVHATRARYVCIGGWVTCAQQHRRRAHSANPRRTSATAVLSHGRAARMSRAQGDWHGRRTVSFWWAFFSVILYCAPPVLTFQGRELTISGTVTTGDGPSSESASASSASVPPPKLVRPTYCACSYRFRCVSRRLAATVPGRSRVRLEERSWESSACKDSCPSRRTDIRRSDWTRELIEREILDFISLL